LGDKGRYLKGEITVPARINRVGIVGYGVVGKAMKTLFPGAEVYDTAPGLPADRAAINACDAAFVCVPTPPMPDGSCDVSAVEETVAWLATPLIVLRSTVPPGTTERLAQRFGKSLVFQPEYLGETNAHPYADPREASFIVLGGNEADCAAVADLYAPLFHSSTRFHFTDTRTAELAKYMENCFFAAKVVFCAEFFRIAKSMGVSYPMLREIWLADGRICPDHTFVYPDRLGFDGKCLPKDLSAIIYAATALGYRPRLLEAVAEVNAGLRREAEAAGRKPAVSGPDATFDGSKAAGRAPT